MANLNTETNQNSLPVMNYRRYRYYYTKNVKTSLNTGMVIPIYCNELVQPGDTFKVELGFVCRETTPFQPVMDNLDIQFMAFAVDWLDIWDDTKPFWGENVNGAWAQETEYVVPQITIPAGTKVTAHSLLAYLGFPQKVYTNELQIGGGLSVNAYCSIYNEWIRNESYIPPLEINLAGTTITYSADDVTKGGTVKNSMKYRDRFTTGTPAPQRGDPVPVPFGTNAPVVGNGNQMVLTNGNNNYLNFTQAYAAVSGKAGMNLANYTEPKSLPSTASSTYSVGVGLLGLSPNPENSGVYADLSEAISATLAAQRLAVATNHILEKMALYGGRYREIVQACWGVKTSDLSQHIPEYLGGWRQPLNMEQVTANTASGENQILGSTGAMSLTNGAGELFTKSFTQHAVIMVLATIRHDQTYGQGIPAQYWKQKKFDYYWNDYANISFQPVINGEIYAQGTDEDKEAFSFLPPWSEYTYEQNELTGMFNPYYSTNDATDGTTNWLKEWTYANNFESLPAMGQDFLEQTPINVDRTIQETSALADQFILDCEFNITKWSEIPSFRLPGLDRF